MTLSSHHVARWHDFLLQPTPNMNHARLVSKACKQPSTVPVSSYSVQVNTPNTDHWCNNNHHQSQASQHTSPSSCASRARLFRRSLCSDFLSPFCFRYSSVRFALLPTSERLRGILTLNHDQYPLLLLAVLRVLRYPN